MSCTTCHESYAHSKLDCPGIPKHCTVLGCTNDRHPASQEQQCGFHQLKGWREELRLRWMALPLDVKDTAEAEAEVRVWEALQ